MSTLGLEPATQPHWTAQQNWGLFPGKVSEGSRELLSEPRQRKTLVFPTDRKIRSEYCPFPVCKGIDTTKCYFRDISLYNGTVSETESGMKCLRWDSAEVKKKCRNCQKAKYFEDKSLKDASNYCRSPMVRNNTIRNRPWCFTENNNAMAFSMNADNLEEWEYCDIPKCPEKCSKIVEDTFAEAVAKERIFFGKNHYVLKESQAECIAHCQKTPGCHLWSYISTAFSHKAYHKQCYLLYFSQVGRPFKGVSTGGRVPC